MVNKQRPNTGVDDSFLSADIVLCCGEDWNELLLALSNVTSEWAHLYHEYRCYRIRKFPQFSLIWSGMGTACVEPLLYELRSASFIRNIVLIGTAGATSTKRVRLGEVYIAKPAFLAGTAVKTLIQTLPLVPRFPKIMLAKTNLRTVSIASTDYYYGFSTDADSETLRAEDLSLRQAVNILFNSVDLIDMETAQFYYFCQALFHHGSLSYVSLKGAANFLAGQALQTTHSLEILRKAIAASFLLLRVQAQTLTS